jgi:hypothetical protein
MFAFSLAGRKASFARLKYVIDETIYSGSFHWHLEICDKIRRLQTVYYVNFVTYMGSLNPLHEPSG